MSALSAPVWRSPVCGASVHRFVLVLHQQAMVTGTSTCVAPGRRLLDNAWSDGGVRAGVGRLSDAQQSVADQACTGLAHAVDLQEVRH